MSYEKQNWQTGDIISADKLNHMEAGIGEGGTPGTPGARGNTIRITDADPGATDGFQAGDLTIQKTTWHLWAFDGKAWQDQGSMKGDKGDTGDTGAPGANDKDGTNGKDGAKGDSGLTPQAAEADLAADADLATIVTKLNAVLAKLRTAGVIAAK